MSIDRRRLLTGAVASVAGLARLDHAAKGAPSPPIPVRIQTPDLAFVSRLQELRDQWAMGNQGSDLLLSVVPAEPAAASLLEDARSGSDRFAGAIVPNWLIPDLVRDSFIRPAMPPPTPIPAPIAQLRSFGGEWIATDLDHDCDLLFFRRDLLDAHGFEPAQTWDALIEQGEALTKMGLGGVGTPTSHAQQVVDHLASFSAAFVLAEEQPDEFWFDPETMTPAIGSAAHQRALEQYRRLSQTMPPELRSGSTGDLWNAFLAGDLTYVIGSADLLPYAIDRAANVDVLGVAMLPGVASSDGTIARAGNVTGASWGGVTMTGADASDAEEVTDFLRTLAQHEAQFELVSDSSSGVTPAPASADDVDALAAALGDRGWPTRITTEWLQAIHDTYASPVQLPALRIAETRRYLQALDDRTTPYLGGDDSTSRDVLSAAADDWDAINEAIGIDTQRDLYTRSLMPPPAR
ncbi:MAG: ABC transporter substrate-binding protein [Thermomicrobiales bacterium]